MKVLMILVIALLALVGVVAARQLPEIQRYRKIQSMS
jgi:type II secretory pathway component PulJ